MRIGKRRKNICLFMAIVLLFFGMGVEITDTDSYFACENSFLNKSDSVIESAEINVMDSGVCTLNMIKGGYISLRNISNSAIIRYHNRVYFSAFFLTAYLLYRSIYQSSESKEDGQLFLCRSVIIDYIHQKDSGE